MNLLDIEFCFYFFRTVGNIELVAVDLGEDEVYVGHGGLDEGLILAALGELVEMGSQFHEVGFGFDMLVEGSHLMICLFAEDEESDLVVGLDVHEVVDVGGDELEDEHDVVSFVEVQFFVPLDGE